MFTVMQYSTTIKAFFLFSLATVMVANHQTESLNESLPYRNRWMTAPDESHIECTAEDWPYFFCLNRPFCFTMQQTCDGYDDCGDSSDECESMCKQTFQCQTGSQCIALNKFCDGVADCIDGSDEKPSHTEGFSCGNSWRIMSALASNTSHWKERLVPMNPEIRQTFKQIYAERKCTLPPEMLCDGVNHCGDHSDECNTLCGPEKKFICQNGNCVSKESVCDRREDCGDGSDECNSHCKVGYLCQDGTCIAFNKFCDGFNDCADGSDEVTFSQSASSPSYYGQNFTCSNMMNFQNIRCLLPLRYVCDGYEHCLDREDECSNDCEYSFKCNNNKCIVKSKVCDGWDDCGDMSDECGSDLCKTLFRCDDGSCLSLDRFCNGISDCSNGEDEYDDEKDLGFFCENPFKTFIDKINNTVTNRRLCRLPSRHVCDGVAHCHQRSDEYSKTCKNSFACDQGEKHLSHQSLCDGIVECSDHTDEPYKPIANLRGFKCVVSRKIDGQQQCVIPQEFVNEPWSDCIDESDSCKDTIDGVNVGGCTTCLLNTNITISKRQLCDGIFDCPDLSDECLCQNVAIPNICQNICFGAIQNSTIQNSRCICPIGMIPCLDEASITNRSAHINADCINVELFCNGIVNCDNGVDELYCGVKAYCNLTNHSKSNFARDKTCSLRRMACPAVKSGNIWTPEYAVACNNKPECMFMEDECDSNCPEPLPYYCTLRNYGGYFACNGTGTLPGRLVCNGIWNCEQTGSIKYDEKDCPGRILCKSGNVVSVEEQQMCDFIEDCEDGSDEANCSTHFYCENNHRVFFRKRHVLDGKNDCEDGSDECPEEFLVDSQFSSRKHMIKSTFLQGMVWIMGTVALVGNLAVIVHTIDLLIHSVRYKLTKVAMVYNCLVLNLSVADLIMGIFLISLGVTNLSMASNYCRHDRSWRSSALCSSLGVLVVVSTEVSLITLVVLSGYRLYCVLRPVQSRGLKINTTLIFIICSWVFASIIALLPLLVSLEDLFITAIWVPNNIYFHSDLIFKQNISTFTSISFNYRNSLIGSKFRWKEMIKIMQEIDSHYIVQGYFGYYSADATCLPKLFLERGDIAWQYSLGIIIFNFILCIVIVFVYAFIWRPHQVNKSSVSCEGTRNMQRKIALLVITDCSCWLPVCLIAFLRFSGFFISDGVYSFTAIILLPINSSLNPLFYSNALQIFYTKLRVSLLKTYCVRKIRRNIQVGNINLCRKSIERKKEAEEQFLPCANNNHNRPLSLSCSRLTTDHTSMDTTVMAESAV